MKNLLKVSVVTVVYNDAASVIKTLQSVKEQTYNNIEFIVVDGGSTDATLSIIDDFSDVITFLVSEIDHGIYDAMNKGTGHATGDYITFLNAGDVYHSSTVIEKMFADNDAEGFDVIYGSNYYYINNKMLLQVPRTLELFYKGMPFNHQSAFVRTSLAKKYPFKNEVYRIQCEYDFLINLYIKGYSFYCSDLIVAIYEAGGYSEQNTLERTLERWLILKRAGIGDDVADEHYFGLVSQMTGYQNHNVKNKKEIGGLFSRFKKYLPCN